MYTSCFTARRFLLAFIIAFCKISIVLQVFLADILSTILLCFYFSVLPMASTYLNGIEIFNEIIIIVCIWLLFQQTEYVGDVKTRYELAQNMLYFVACVIATNVLFIAYFALKKIYEAVRLRLMRKKARKWRALRVIN